MKHIWTDQSSSHEATNQRGAERRAVAFPARLTWKDQHGATRFASVVARNVSDYGVYVECHSIVSIPLYRLVQFQLEREARESDALPEALRQGRVLSAVYRVSRSDAGGQTAGARAAADGGSEAAAGSNVEPRARHRVDAHIFDSRWGPTPQRELAPMPRLGSACAFGIACAVPCCISASPPLPARPGLCCIIGMIWPSADARQSWLSSSPSSPSTRPPTKACGRSTTRRRPPFRQRYGFTVTDRLARSSAPVERAAQRWRLRIVRLRRRPRPDEPSRGARPASEALDGAEELRGRRVRRDVARRGDEGHRPGDQRPDVVRRSDVARRRARPQRAAARRPRSRRAGPKSRPSRKKASIAPACDPTSSPSIRGRSTGSIATRSTRTCAWSSRPSSRWRFSAAIPTTSPIRATTSTLRSSASTKMAFRCAPSTI